MMSQTSLNAIDFASGKKVQVSYLLLLFLAPLFSTELRVLLLIIYPVLVLVIMATLQLKLSRSFFNIIFILIIGCVLSWRNGFYLKYNIISLYYVVPFLALLFSVPGHDKNASVNFKIFFYSLTFFVILNDIFGIMQYFTNPDDDSFRGIYGKFTVTQNGLALLNSVLFFFYLQRFLIDKRKLNLFFAFFFIFCTVLGFYGAGMVVLLVSVAFYYIRFKVKSLIRILFISIFLGVGVVMLMISISPKTFEYNVNIFKRFLSPSGPSAPRKLKIGYDYLGHYSSDPVSLAFGSGPGTFNSRSAFMVGSPSYFPNYPVKSEVQPYYFKNFAYELWNPSNITRYDGFVSQPFSSLLAFFGEYGLIFSLLLLYGIYTMYQRVRKLYSKAERAAGKESIYARMYRFLLVFMFFLIAIDNYIEYPEVVGLLLIMIKLSEVQIFHEQQSIAAGKT